MPLVEGRNIALVDLFDPDHARKVLAAFGRAYNRLPENLRQCTPEQRQFVDRAVAELGQEGKVICVRLALFAEMMKGKPWTPAILRAGGGTEGVGFTFLEETFSARQRRRSIGCIARRPRPSSRPCSRRRAPTSRATCGRRDELLAASGCAAHPESFAELLQILDTELRLITPTEPEGHGDDAALVTLRPEARGESSETREEHGADAPNSISLSFPRRGRSSRVRDSGSTAGHILPIDSRLPCSLAEEMAHP